MHIQNFIKIHPFVLKILRKNTFLHQSRAITLLFINKFSPFAIQNHSSPISMSMQSLKKIGQKLLKSESGNKALTDGHSKRFGGYNKIPRHFFVAGYKNRTARFDAAAHADRTRGHVMVAIVFHVFDFSLLRIRTADCVHMDSWANSYRIFLTTLPLMNITDLPCRAGATNCAG